MIAKQPREHKSNKNKNRREGTKERKGVRGGREKQEIEFHAIKIVFKMITENRQEIINKIFIII